MKSGLIALAIAALVLIAPLRAAAATIVVDAGHGGSDPGAVGVNGLYEKHVNLDIAYKLKVLLVRQGYDVVLTRESDEFISLADRVAQTNAANPALFVSVHANSHPNSAVSGSLVLYYDKDYPQPSYPASDAMTALSPESKKLAGLVLQRLVANTGFKDNGLVPSAAYVIRMGQVPSILVETAFLSNAGDAGRLADESVRQRIAKGIAEGIAAYWPASAFPDLIGHWAQEAVMRLKEQGIVKGTGNRYEPDRPVTRAEWLTAADRLFDFGKRIESGKGGKTSVTDATYADLKTSHWAYDTITQAICLGYINGYEDGTVRPDRPITRAEVAVLLERMTSGTGSAPWDGAASFSDVPKGHWAAGAIYRLKRQGILNGVTDKTFAPAKSMTRAEMATMIDRYLTVSGAKPKSDAKSPSHTK
jgi:N-acetylmuramoyl-L-alanine amidase